jgi:nitrate/nitrite transporter NarK
MLVPSSTGWLLGLILLIGVAQTLVPAPIFALPPEVTSTERLGLGFGIVSTCLNLGIVVDPATVGLIRDVTGSYQSSYMLMAGLALLITVAMLILHFQQRKKPAQ